MPSAAASAILEGMPEAADLRVLRSDGVTWIFAGKTALFRFADGDAGMRNIAVAALRQIGFPGTQVAAALGLTTNYVATLHQRAQREGTAGLVRPRGRPRTVTGQDWERARAWRGQGVRDAEIARRLGVQQSTVLRQLGPARVQGELALEDGAAEPASAVVAGREIAVAEYIDWFNHRRLHGEIGLVPPVEIEAQHNITTPAQQPAPRDIHASIKPGT